MSQEVRATRRDPSVKQGLAAGTSVGAAIILATLGVVSVLQGIAAVAEDEIFVVGLAYTYEFDVTTWGWIHIVVGALMILIGVALMTGTTWARVTAIVIAAISVIANFLWLPYYPWWSTLIIALNIVVIWAVSTWKPTQTTHAAAHAPSTPTRSA